MICLNYKPLITLPNILLPKKGSNNLTIKGLRFEGIEAFGISVNGEERTERKEVITINTTVVV